MVAAPGRSDRFVDLRRYRLRWAALLSLTCLVGQPSIAAEWNIVPFRPPDGCTFEEVREICATSDGAVWFASWGCGVARLQGAEWRVFTERDGLPSNFAPSITDGGDNSVWVATDAGVARIEENRVAPFTVRTVSHLDAAPTMVRRMPNGEIWIGQAGGGVVGCRRRSTATDVFEWTVIREGERGSVASVHDLLQSSDGKVWAALERGGLDCLEDGVWRTAPLPHLFSERVKDVFEDHKGRLWIAGSGAIGYIDGDGWRVVDPGDGSQCLTESPQGEIICGTAKSVVAIRDDHCELIPFPLSVGQPKVRQIHFTRNSGAWIGTKEGILQLRAPRWQDVSHANDEVMHMGHAFFARPTQAPLAVDSKNTLVRFSSDQWSKLVELPGPLHRRPVLTAPVSNHVWFRNGTQVTKVRLHPPRVQTTIELPSELLAPESETVRLLAIKSGELLAYGQGGAFRLENEAWTRCGPQSAREPIVSMQLMNSGALLVGLMDRAESWQDGRIDRVWAPAGVTASHSLTFASESSDGRIWLGTRGLGLFLFDQSLATNLTVRDGLPSARIICLLESSDGTLWFGAEHKGISSLRDGRWVHYSHSDGLPSEGLVALGEYPDGIIWAAYDDLKAVRFEPDDDPPETNVVAAPFKIAPHGVGHFSFSGYDLFNHTPQNELQYSWRIVGNSDADDSAPWSPFQPQSTFTSNALAAGVYRVQVRAQDRDRNVDPTPAEIQVEVMPPVWQRAEVVVPLLGLFAVACMLGTRVYRYHREIKSHRDRLDELVKDRTSQLVFANQAMEAEKERLAVTLESIGDGVIATDSVGKIVLMNAKAASLVHYTEARARDRRLSELIDLLDEETRKPIRNPVAQVLAGHPIKSAHVIAPQRNGGSERIFAISAAPIKNSCGTTAGVVVVARDVTEKRSLEQQRSKLRQIEAIGVLAGGIAHDFNNLLSAMLTNISLLQDQSGQSDRVRLRDTEKACLRARGLTQQLLTFSKGGAPLRESLRIADVIRDSAEFSLQGSNVCLRLKLDDDLWVVRADAEQISQVVQNIVINADHSMPEGGTLTISARNTEIEAKDDDLELKGRFVRVSFADQGTGIEEQQLQQIFDPYYTTDANGNGLGLAICHSIIHRHEGSIRVNSVRGYGSTFDVYLPASCESSDSRACVTPDNPAAVEPQNILVMDDHPLVLNAVKAVLELDGHRAFIATNSDEALQVCSQARMDGTPIKLAILDLTIPGGPGGKETVQELIRMDPHIKRIVSSGYSDDPIMANCREYGFHARIAKPYRHEELKQVIGQVLAED